MNLRIESSSVLSGLPATDPFLLPIMWFEDSIEKIPETIHDMLKDALTSGSGIAFKIFVAIVVLLVVELVLFFAFLATKFSNSENCGAAVDGVDGDGLQRRRPLWKIWLNYFCSVSTTDN